MVAESKRELTDVYSEECPRTKKNESDYIIKEIPEISLIQKGIDVEVQKMINSVKLKNSK